MTRIFHAPVATYTPCSEEAEDAIEALFALGPRPDGTRTACLRADLYVADADFLTLLRQGGVDLYMTDASGSLELRRSGDLDPELRSAFADVLLAINDDQTIGELASAYPLPWNSQPFNDEIKGRYLSLLFFGDRIGGMIQEYIPSWLGRVDADLYFEDDADAEIRAELFSVFLPQDNSNHARLASEAKLPSKQKAFTDMFGIHCDGEEDITLAQVDLVDRL